MMEEYVPSVWDSEFRSLFGVSTGGLTEKRNRWRGYHDFRTVASVLAPMRRWVEVGAGSGALSEEIRSLGGRCVATDNHSWGHFQDKWDRENSICAEASRVCRLVSKYPTIGVIVAWPSHDESWAGDAVGLLSSGQTVAYVGEGMGGCTGDDALHVLLDEKFEMISEHDIEQVGGIHDWLTIYERK